MEQILENGTEVLIFKYIPGLGLEQDMKQYIKGTIIKSEMSEDLSYHGSPWYVTNYTVLGEDGMEYFGNYGNCVIGSSYFMTEEDYISYLIRKIELNNAIITEIENENEELEEIITNIRTQSKQEVKSRVK